jgi:hypothetical protein
MNAENQKGPKENPILEYLGAHVGQRRGCCTMKGSLALLEDQGLVYIGILCPGSKGVLCRLYFLPDFFFYLILHECMCGLFIVQRTGRRLDMST